MSPELQVVIAVGVLVVAAIVLPLWLHFAGLLAFVGVLVGALALIVTAGE